ncbi:MAG: hypothetical protein J2P16_00165 [Mycobacterium sp.]|nr:hypothetical protein [Mycobacterium sp.]
MKLRARRRRRRRQLTLAPYRCPQCGAVTDRTVIASHRGGHDYLVGCGCGYRLEEHRR